jgi:hypothetical protein
MTNKLKKLARNLSSKTGMSYQAAINVLFTARDAKIVRSLLEEADNDPHDGEFHERLLAVMVPSILKASEVGSAAELAEPVVVAFVDDEIERPTDEKEEVTVHGKTFLANVVESGPSLTEQRIQAAGGVFVARSESEGHVMGIAVVPRAPWFDLLHETYGHDDLPVTPGKITVCMLSILADDNPIVRQFSREELRDLPARLTRLASAPSN